MELKYILHVYVRFTRVFKSHLYGIEIGVVL